AGRTAGALRLREHWQLLDDRAPPGRPQLRHNRPRDHSRILIRNRRERFAAPVESSCPDRAHQGEWDGLEPTDNRLLLGSAPFRWGAFLVSAHAMRPPPDSTFQTAVSPVSSR